MKYLGFLTSLLLLINVAYSQTNYATINSVATWTAPTTYIDGSLIDTNVVLRYNIIITDWYNVIPDDMPFPIQSLVGNVSCVANCNTNAFVFKNGTYYRPLKKDTKYKLWVRTISPDNSASKWSYIIFEFTNKTSPILNMKIQ